MHADNLGVSDFFASVAGNVFIMDRVERVGAFDALAVGSGAGSDALAETAEFVGIGLVPDVLVFRVSSELAVLKSLACIQVDDWASPVSEEC